MTLPTRTVKKIRARTLAHNPAEYFPEGWRGNALDVLRMDQIPARFRLEIVLFRSWIGARTLRLFAVWCARQALAKIANPDPRAGTACEVAELFAQGKATRDALKAACAAARQAQRDARDPVDRLAYGAAAAASSTLGHGAWLASVSAVNANAGRDTEPASNQAQVARLIEMLSAGEPPRLDVIPKKIWTLGYFPSTLGSELWQPVGCEVPAQGPFDVGKGYQAYVIVSPNGTTFVAESETGAIIGPSLDEVRADIAAGEEAVMRKQIEEARVKAARARPYSPQDFWKMLKAA